MSGIEFTLGGDDAPNRKPTASTAPKSAAPGKRPPGRPSTSAKQKDNVAGALSTMESAYSALSMGALLINKPITAELVARGSEQWQASNRQAFESSPKLAATIASVGQASGVATFVITNVVAFGSILLTLRKEAAAQVEANTAKDAPDNG